jgi:HEPN domain-containing protein
MKYISEKPANSLKWLESAKEDLRLGKQGQECTITHFESRCFLCQQAGEKALKALMIFKEIKYPKTHFLDELIREIEKNNITIPDEIKEMARTSSPYQRRPMFPFKFPFILSTSASASLTDHAEKTRYPGDYVSLDHQAYKHALEKANTIVSWVEQQIRIENQKNTE